MKYHAALLLPLVLCCGGNGGGSTASTPPTAGTFQISTGVITSSEATLSDASLNSGRMDFQPSNPGMIAPASVKLKFSIAAHQGGSFVAGYSGRAWRTLEFNLSTKVNGVTVGSNGVSQTFTKDDPSINPNGNNLTGDATFAYQDQQQIGLFMAQISATNSTVMSVVAKQDASRLPNGIDEVVLRLGNPTDPLKDASGNTAWLVGSPHFFIGPDMYSDATANLTVATQYRVRDFQYILFMPSSKIGANASFFVTGTNTVIDPVTGDYGPATDPSDASTWQYVSDDYWTIKPVAQWIDDPGCAGIVQVINTITGTSPVNYAAADPTWQSLAAYFQAYFVKFYSGRSTMFQPHGTLGNLDGNGILGNTSTSASFEIVALDDSNGPMAINSNSTLSILYDAAKTTYAVSNGILDVSGTPPLRFVTKVMTK